MQENELSTYATSPSKIIKVNTIGKHNRFIVLGSSGEALPVTRKSIGQISVYNSCNSQSTDSFHSAKDTIDDEPGKFFF
jgi:poly(ADP-ribose) glycohydrolase